MQKSSTFLSTKSLIMTLLCWLMVGLSAGQLRAADNLDIPQLEVGKTYAYSAYQEVYAAYQATSSGLLTLRNSSPYGTFLNRYGERYKEMQSETLQMPKDGVLEVEVEAGQTYYFYAYMMDAGSFSVEFDNQGAQSEVVIASITPEQGETLKLGDGVIVSLAFVSDVKFDRARISCGEYSQDIDLMVTTGRYASVELDAVIAQWMAEGKIKAGDQFTITVENLRDAKDENIKYNGDGVLQINYVCGTKPLELVSVKGGSLTELMEVKSYYLYTDEDAIISLTFDGELLNDPDNQPVATWTFGDLEYGKFYTETIPATVEGNTVSVSLAGKRRTIADMLPNEDPAELAEMPVGLKIGNIRDKEGNFVRATQPGAVGAFTMSYKLKELAYTVASEFTPAIGSALPQGGNIEIWLQGDPYIKYDGVDFTYISGGETCHAYVYNNHITKKKDELDETAVILTVPVPRIVADMPSTVTVSLIGLQALDGFDHSADVRAEYDASEPEDNAMTVTASSPADGATMEAVQKGTIFTMTTSMDEQIGYMTYEIYDTKDEEIVKARTFFQKAEEGGWASEFFFNMIMKEGHDYEVRISGYASEDDYNYGGEPIGETVITWHGSTKAFEYSDITLLSITPEPDPLEDFQLQHPVQIKSEDDNTIVATFSGGVNLEAFLVEGYGATSELESCTPNEDKTQWTMVIAKSYIASAGETITISMNATDAATGKRVKGELGEEDQSYWILAFTNTVNVPDITVDPDGSEPVEEMKDFTISYSGGISPSYLGGKYIRIYNKATRLQVDSLTYAQIEQVIPEGSAWDYVPTQVKCTLHEALADGSYYMVIPRGIFILGVDMQTNNNKETIVNFSVGNGQLKAEFMPASVTPESGSTVTSLKEIRLHMPATFSINEAEPQTVTVTDRTSGKQVATGTIARDEEDEFMTIKVTLDKEITAQGVYFVVIPQGAFGDDEYGVDYTTGNCNPKLIYTYAVESEGGSDIIVTPADGEKLTELSVIRFEGPVGFDYMGTVTVKDQNGEVVATVAGSEVKVEYDPENPFGDPLYMEIALEEPITADGVYTVEVPEGFFYVGENADNAPAMTLTYQVGNGDGISQVQAAEGKVTVYTVSGRLVYRNADPAVIKNLHKGIYIINGRKCVVK